jgi:hypothetical protein
MQRELLVLLPKLGEGDVGYSSSDAVGGLTGVVVGAVRGFLTGPTARGVGPWSDQLQK